MSGRPKSRVRRIVEGALRVFLVACLSGILGFAVGLFGGILGLVLYGAARGVRPDMAIAYRYVAVAVGSAAFLVAFLTMLVLESRNRRHQQLAPRPDRTPTRAA